MSDLFNRGFFVRQPAWHGKGVVVQDYPGIDEAMKLAGHDHRIITKPLFTFGDVSEDPNTAQYNQLAGWKAIIREDTGSVVSVMNASYEVIQNRVPWELIDQLFKEGAKWDTAGVLNGRYDENNKEVKGQVYWCMSLLDEPGKVNGDDSLTYPYLAATWAHDGSQSLRIRAMGVRVVCANTHHAAMYGADGADLDVSIRHIGDVRKRIESAKLALSMVRKAQSKFLEIANDLVSLRVSDAGIQAFIETIVPMPVATVVTDRVRNNIERARGQVRAIFDSPTVTPAIRNTAYGMVEAGVEFFDHVRRYLHQDTYFSRNVMKVDATKAALISTAREIAAANAA
jgi:phage/plasmid-like protein (TIGR03299 family)